MKSWMQPCTHTAAADCYPTSTLTTILISDEIMIWCPVFSMCIVTTQVKEFPTENDSRLKIYYCFYYWYSNTDLCLLEGKLNLNVFFLLKHVNKQSKYLCTIFGDTLKIYKLVVAGIYLLLDIEWLRRIRPSRAHYSNDRVSEEEILILRLPRPSRASFIQEKWKTCFPPPSTEERLMVLYMSRKQIYI